MGFLRAWARLAPALCIILVGAIPAFAAERTITADGIRITSYGLVGVGRLPASLLDKLGETFGSGSAMAFESWQREKDAGSYRGSLLLLPDRGHNTEGPIDYRARINRLSIKFVPVSPDASPGIAGQRSVEATLERPILLTDTSDKPFTGLDPVATAQTASGDDPILPQVHGRIAIDPEGLARAADGKLYVSDEYGPYIYEFSPQGRLLEVIAPPPAFIPMRGGVPAFSAEDPQPQSGRVNNRGLEGLSLTPGGKELIAALQSPVLQDGGKTGEYTRVLAYDVDHMRKPIAEYVVTLPAIKKGYAGQSEVLALSGKVLLMLSRDSGRGYGTGSRKASKFRNIGVVDLKDASNILGMFDAPEGTVLDDAQQQLRLLKDGKQRIVSATFQDFIDINDEAQLQRFGLHNGGGDRDSLSEKWESLGLVSALDPDKPDDFFLFVANDNDFITANGHHAGKDYSDPQAVEVDTMFLVYRLRVERPARP